jgi:hypothetical protein
VSTLRLIPTSGSPIEITKDPALLGRDPACDVVLNDGSVSRRHARIERRGDGWAIVDQGSANGTFLDSHRVTDAAIGDGQELRLGSVTLRIEAEVPVDLSATIGGSGEATVIQPSPSRPSPASGPPPVPQPSTATPPPPPRAAVPPPPPPSTSTARPSVSPVRPMDPGGPPPKKGKGPLFWIATGCFGCLTMVALVIGLIAGGIYFMGKGSVDVVDQFLSDVRLGKMDDAYGRLSQDYRARLSQGAFENAVAEHPALKDNAEGRFSVFKGGSVSIVNDRGVVKGTLVSTSGRKESAVIGLVKESGAWKITAVVLDGNDLAGGMGGLSGDVEPESSP